MKAGEVCKAAGLGKETLRYYEKIGVITTPARGSNGYRLYDPLVLQELRFIKLAQSVGFTLNEIKPAIPFLSDPDPNCPELKAALENQLERVNTQLTELQSSKETIERWLSKR